MKKILEVEHVSKRFSGLLAIDDVSFSVNEGEIIGIVGPNGAGKTTLFHCISGVHPISGGKVVFDGKDVSAMKANNICKLGVGRTFQIPQPLNEMTILENVMVGALRRHDSINKAWEKAEEWVDFCGLTKYAHNTVGNLNVIQKKRIEIARALATEPRLIMLDETMAGLTATERKDAVDLIWRINAKGIAILTIEHVMDVVMAVSNRVIVIQSGKLLMEGTPAEVSNDQRVIQAYLGGKGGAAHA